MKSIYHMLFESTPNPEGFKPAGWWRAWRRGAKAIARRAEVTALVKAHHRWDYRHHLEILGYRTDQAIRGEGLAPFTRELYRLTDEGLSGTCFIRIRPGILRERRKGE